ncbi:hypothetical protein BC939DRAFT_508020 [Gamsiella multidivaricata]|uniref:uncharacterized protein n=1 Tax=Gamsiella multidivaricata TaxID=101098 RepID=UPI0022211A4D|nr:uncharacterized protein BC939DRAFT_508020 [Gamsiella multidivaricata]KAI7816755.1 hypothetical protein BC939DRAFT_508020 [Gamsiella multidivaricata]
MFPTYKLTNKFTGDIPNLDDYFTTFDSPALWHPEHYASQPESTSMNSFLKGLDLICFRGKGSISTFAGRCLRFLKSEEGRPVLDRAKLLCQVRLENENKSLSQLSFTLSGEKTFYSQLAGAQKCVSRTPPSSLVKRIEDRLDKQRQDDQEDQGDQEDQEEQQKPQKPQKQEKRDKALVASICKRSNTAVDSRLSKRRPSARANSFHIDADTMIRTVYEINEEDVGAAFYNFQLAGVALANDLDALVTRGNFACILIWDTSQELGDLTAPTFLMIKGLLMRELVRFKEAQQLLLCRLESDLASGHISTYTGSDPLEARLFHIFQSLCYELPATYYAFEAIGEDTFVHRVVHTLFTCIFKDFDVEWANHQSAASKSRRGGRGLEGVRPDLSLSKKGYIVLSMEVKPPIYDRRSTVYLKDRWKLASLAKDELDDQLRENVDLPYFVAVQVFGHRMEISTMTLMNGVYHFHRNHEVYLPRARDDVGAVRNSIEALLSVEAWLKEFKFPPTYMKAGARTPPRKVNEVKKTLISPSQRELFSSTRE